MISNYVKPPRRFEATSGPVGLARVTIKRRRGRSAVIGALTAAAAVLLGVAGLAKARSPAPAAAMITRVIPRTRGRSRALTSAVRVGGGVEAVIAVAFLSIGGRVAAALVAACYLVFTVVALRLATDRRHTSCGCFGAADSPVGVAHVVLDAVCLAATAASVAIPVGAGGGRLEQGALVAVVGCGQVLLLAWLGYLAITALPALASLRRPEEAR
jgi:hypothetical protein